MLHRLVHREGPRIALAVRGTVAALSALAVAVALQLECPYWAAMTALIVIQPTHGLLLEKSYYRLIGTAIGSVGGMTMLLTSRSPAMLTIMLSFWLAACVGAGNLAYGLRSYGAMVAGCTGAVIAMSGYNNPPHLNDLVFGRIACIVIGIVVSTTVTLFFTHRRAKRELLDRLTKVVVTDLEWAAMLLRGGEERELLALRQDILVEIADIEGSLDAAWAGSLDLKLRKRHIRSLIVNLLSLLEAGTLAGDHLVRQGSPADDAWRESLARHLEETARNLDRHGSTRSGDVNLAAVLAEVGAHLPLLGETLKELVTALQLVIDEWDTTAPDSERPAPHNFIRHRDWQEAGRAALRAACAMAAVGTVWYFTGWNEGALMMMAASIMVSIFSTHDRPSVMLTHIFCGASLGVAAAFLCRLVLLPGASSPLLQGICSIPLLMAGMVALHHRRTALGAMDTMLFFLFVMQPGVPIVPAPAKYVEGGLACLGGIAVAILFFRFLLPIDPARRLRSLLLAIVQDLIAMAEGDALLRERCRARMHHRVLRMLANARKLDNNLGTAVEGGLAALAIGRCLQLRGEAGTNDGVSPVASDAIREITIRLSAARQRPEKILSVLEDVSGRLCRATEAHSEAHRSSRSSLPARGDAPPFPANRLLLGKDWRTQCHT
jgi:uncharacterized membrane protein YccC